MIWVVLGLRDYYNNWRIIMDDDEELMRRP